MRHIFECPSCGVHLSLNHETNKQTNNRIAANLLIKQTNKQVSYHHNNAAEEHHFGATHPMKPWRLTLTNQLVLGYGLHEKMAVYSSRKASEEELKAFHVADYLDFLKRYIYLH